ncbi:MAG: hypothetical protein Q9160_005312 [Pyrenula sp. 1 TL-2023]
MNVAHDLSTHTARQRLSYSRNRSSPTSTITSSTDKDDVWRSTQKNKARKRWQKGQSKGLRSSRRLTNNNHKTSYGKNHNLPRRLSIAATSAKQSTVGAERRATQSMSGERASGPACANPNDGDSPKDGFASFHFEEGHGQKVVGKVMTKRASIVGDDAMITGSTDMLQEENGVKRAEIKLKAAWLRARWAEELKEDAKKQKKEAEEQIEEANEELEMALKESSLAMDQIWRAVEKGDPYASKRYPISTIILDAPLPSPTLVMEMIGDALQPLTGPGHWTPLSLDPRPSDPTPSKPPQTSCSLM